MAWIKRNLYFVITVVAGLGVTGYCGYLFFTERGTNSEASTKYTQDRAGYELLHDQNPYPDTNNITAAQQDQERVRQFLADFRKAFADFSTPPKLDARGFKDYLQKTVNQFTRDAANAGVEITTNYAFSFQGQMENLSPPPESIDPWMQQLVEIKAILQILFNAKINYLEHIRRPAVSSDDIGSPDDYIPQGNGSNQWGVVTPYKVEFRGFTAELAAVLAGFAQSSNCFIVKTIIVIPNKTPLAPLAPPSLLAPPQNYPPMRRPPSDIYMPPGMGRGREERGERFRQRAPTPQPAPGAGAPTGPVLPEKILSEQLLFITLYVDVVKLKAPAAPSPPPRAVKPRR